MRCHRAPDGRARFAFLRPAVGDAERRGAAPGISDDEAERAVALALERGRILTDGSDPPHSVSLIWG